MSPPTRRLPPLGPRRLALPRRRFLQATAAATALPFVGAGCGPGPGETDAGPEPLVRPHIDPDDYDDAQRVPAFADTVAVDEALFPLGVQAGVMQPTSLLLWGYTADGTAKRLKVWRETGDEAEVALVFDDDVTPTAAGTFRAEVTGLAPDTPYRYALFVADGDALSSRSVVGEVKTAWPEGWVWPVTVGALTCTSFENRPYIALEKMAEEELDFFVHLGDMSYNDGAVTAEEYAVKWHDTLSDPGYRALLAKHGGYYAWDDHEFTNDLNPETIDPTHFATAREAYFHHVAAGEGEGGRLWRSYRWGATAEVFVLDCRTERRPSMRESDATAYLGVEQVAWLKEALRTSPCHFKILMNSVPMTLMPQLWGLAGDRWQGYATARADLLNFIEQEGLEDVWFLSGDFHVGFVGRVGTEGYSRNLWEVAVGPSGNLGNPLSLIADDPENRELVFPEAQFLYGKGRICSTTLTFDPITGRVRVRFIEARTDEVLFDQEIGPDT